MFFVTGLYLCDYPVKNDFFIEIWHLVITQHLIPNMSCQGFETIKKYHGKSDQWSKDLKCPLY